MENGRKRLRIEVFFERYFGNFLKILLTNTLFAIPSAVVFVAFYFLNQLIFGEMNVAFTFLVIVLLYPFYSGVVKVVRDIARGDEDVKVCSTYFAAVKENLLRFSIHGVIVCAAALISYFAITFYVSILSVSWIMYAMLFFSIIIVLLVAYASFYLPLLTVTYDMKLRYIYKNSLLMSFGEFKNNLFATFAIAVVMAIFVTATAFIQSVTVLVIVFSVLWALFLPATVTFAYVFFIYDGMVNIIKNKDSIGADLDAKIAEKGAKVIKKPQMSLEEEDFSDIDVSKLKDSDDFIYHNGRMIKQSTLLRIIKEKESQMDKLE